MFYLFTHTISVGVLGLIVVLGIDKQKCATAGKICRFFPAVDLVLVI